MDFKPTFEEIYLNEINKIKQIKGYLNTLKADTIKEMYNVYLIYIGFTLMTVISKSQILGKIKTILQQLIIY